MHYPAIKDMTPCDLYIRVGDTEVKVANGEAWPTKDAMVHGIPLVHGCAKVLVDDFVAAFKDLPVYGVTITEEVKTVGDMKHCSVQWPRLGLKVCFFYIFTICFNIF